MEFDRTPKAAPGLDQPGDVSLATENLPKVGPEFRQEVSSGAGVRTFGSEPQEALEVSTQGQEAAPCTIGIGGLGLQSSLPNAEAAKFAGRDAGSTEPISTPYGYQTAPEAEVLASAAQAGTQPSVRFPSGLIVGATDEMAARIAA